MRADAEECLLQRVLQERGLDRERGARRPLGRAADVGGGPVAPARDQADGEQDEGEMDEASVVAARDARSF